MKLCFDSIAEVREFVAGLKGTRGKKGDGDEASGDASPGMTGTAPPPLMPGPNTGQPGGFTLGQPQGFAVQGGYPGQPQSYPGAQNPPGADPVVLNLVSRIITVVNNSTAAGQPVDAALNWFRNQCGPEAANATLDQIKQSFLPRLPLAQLETIAKTMNA